MFVSARLALDALRALTGHTLHGGVDPAGPLDGTVLVLVYLGHLALTLALDRHVRGADAPALGLALDARRLGVFVVGGAVGFLAAAAPWLLALALGRAHVVATLGPQLAHVGIGSVAFGLGLGGLNSVVEETACRAFPMRLAADGGALLRVLGPALTFAAFHWIAEPIALVPFVSRTLTGVTLGLAYDATGDIWLAAGLHTGINHASLHRSGLWHFGALARVEGPALVDGLVADALTTALALAVYAAHRRARRRVGSAPA